MKLDDGCYLNVLDDSDLADFIHHHAWFEGDEVALPREGRVYLLGNLTGQTPKKRRVNQSRSDLKVLNATCSSPTETEQYEPDPDCNGADEMMTDETPLDNENGGDSETFVQKPLTSNQKKVIQNIHNNCGHPSKEEFLRALRLSRARPEVLHYVRREFECPACAAKGHPPKPRLPAALPWTFRFNETLGLDICETESPDSSNIVFCNMVCWGTLYQLCIPVVDKTAETLAKCVAERWIQYFGPSLVIIADQGKEFVGTQFKEFTNANSTLLHIIDVRAPWQNGRTERHGEWLHSPSSSVALQRLAMECNAAKNRLSNRSGYSPLQRVFGIGHHLPADLTSDDTYGPDPIYDLAATDASFEESRQIREAAMKAHAEVSILDRIEDSVRARPRTQTVLRADDVIMVRKTNPPSKVAGGLDQVCALERIEAVYGSTCADHCGSAASFSANWLLLKRLEVWRSRTNCWMTGKLSFKSSQDVEFTLMWSVKEFHHQMPISNQWRPEEFKRRRTRTPVFQKRYKVRTCKFRLMFPVIWTVIAVIEPCLKISEIRVGPCRQMSCHVKWKKMCKTCESSILTIL